MNLMGQIGRQVGGLFDWKKKMEKKKKEIDSVGLENGSSGYWGFWTLGVGRSGLHGAFD